jgi:putative ABC transport system substrate-binding protein
MTRRRWLQTVLAALVASPRVANAQRAATVHRIGWLAATTAANGLVNLDALRAGLRAKGYIEGRNITIEARWADGAVERLPALAAELVRLPVHVLCTAGGQASTAAKEATSTIPIVFASVAFPDRSGLVASHRHPGGNVTGVAFIGPEYGKRLELLKEAAPRLSRVGLIYNPNNPGSVLALEETQRWAKALAVRIEPHGFRGPDDFDAVFAAMAGKPPDALMTTADSLIVSYRARIVEFASKHRLLSVYPLKDFVDAGGLMFYGGSIPEMFRHAATYVDKILKGARPGDLPIDQPTKFDMVINLKAAKALGLSIPQSLLLRADHVIE